MHHNLRSPERQLIELQMEHADLDALIDQATEIGEPMDELRLRRFKKRRLALRDQISPTAHREAETAKAHRG